MNIDKKIKFINIYIYEITRLGLERSKTAQEAFDVITALFDIHGQGGPCSDEKSQSQWAYHNSFLIVDGKEAWVLETVGKHWAAQHVSSINANLLCVVVEMISCVL